MKLNKKHKGLFMMVLFTALMLITGTFAWTALSQRALNENEGTTDPGGRIHDDYSKESGNKDIYAENYGEQNLLVRIKLSEYFEKNGEALVEGTTKEDRNSWTPYVLPETVAPSSDYRSYVTWDLGGEKVFLPTFNTASDNKETDATGDAIDFITNGPTAEGTGEHDSFTVGQEVTTPEDTSVTHIAKNTLQQTKAPISMAEWKTLSKTDKLGAYWVIDTDGWAYWSNLLAPKESTSLLLDQLNLNKSEIANLDSWYYGIDVIGEFATMVDKDKFINSEHGGLTPDAQSMLDFIGKENGTFSYKVVLKTDVTDAEVGVGTSKEFEAHLLKISDVTGEEEVVDAELVWSVSGQDPETSIDQNGKLTVALAEPEKSLKVTVKSLERGVQESFDVKVLPEKFTYKVEMPNSNETMTGGTTRQIVATASKTSLTTGNVEDISSQLVWSIEGQNEGNDTGTPTAIDTDGNLTVKPFENSTITVKASLPDAGESITKPVTVNPVKVGTRFDFFGQTYIYLQNKGDGNYFIMHDHVLPMLASNSTTYNGSNIDKKMKAYYENLPQEAKEVVQPVQTSFKVGIGGTKVGQGLAVTNAPKDRAVVTPTGEKKAFALSVAELNDITGPGKAFPKTASREGYLNGNKASPVTWWVRTAYSTTTSWRVVISGANAGVLLDKISSHQYNGRPAMIIHQ